MTILVTGASGVLGRHVVPMLLAQGKSVAATCRGNPGELEKEPLTHLVRCDLRDRAGVRALLNRVQPSKIVHAAAHIARDDSIEARVILDANVLATAILIEEAERHGCERFVFCSSISVYEGLKPEPGGFQEGQALAPKSKYAVSKLTGENILRLAASAKFQGCSLRLAGLHGPGRTSGVVYRMLEAAGPGAPIVVDDPTALFRLLFLRDAAQAIALAVDSPLPDDYSCYNVASRDIFDLPFLAKQIIQLADSRSRIELGTARETDDQVMALERVVRDLGFVPHGLSECLAETWTWMTSRLLCAVT